MRSHQIAVLIITLVSSISNAQVTPRTSLELPDVGLSLDIGGWNVLPSQRGLPGAMAIERKGVARIRATVKGAGGNVMLYRKLTSDGALKNPYVLVLIGSAVGSGMGEAVGRAMPKAHSLGDCIARATSTATGASISTKTMPEYFTSGTLKWATLNTEISLGGVPLTKTIELLFFGNGNCLNISGLSLPPQFDVDKRLFLPLLRSLTAL